jgi:hypothetical protein
MFAGRFPLIAPTANVSSFVLIIMFHIFGSSATAFAILS